MTTGQGVARTGRESPSSAGARASVVLEGAMPDSAYALLGLRQSATKKEIKEAYRALGARMRAL